MTTRLRALDLFCGGGGISRGWADAGFEVEGVDSKVQKDYPFTFHHGDAIEFALAHGHEYDVLLGSPPCQGYCTLTNGTWGGNDDHPLLIDATRRVFQDLGKPYVIENVKGSTVRRDLWLCGTMFGLRVLRHRFFEVHGVRVKQPPHQAHKSRVQGWRHGLNHKGYYVPVYGNGGGRGDLELWSEAMGIDWITTKVQLKEAVPPAYARYIAEVFARALRHRAGTEVHTVNAASDLR